MKVLKGIVFFIDPQIESAHSGYRVEALWIMSIQTQKFPALARVHCFCVKILFRKPKCLLCRVTIYKCPNVIPFICQISYDS